MTIIGKLKLSHAGRMRRPIENNSSLGQAVYEPFSGSTTIIAAEMTGRVVAPNPARRQHPRVPLS
jgi:hypothetical protein